VWVCGCAYILQYVDRYACLLDGSRGWVGSGDGGSYERGAQNTNTDAAATAAATTAAATAAATATTADTTATATATATAADTTATATASATYPLP